MGTATILAVLTVTGSLLGGTAAWAAWLSPRAKAALDAKREAIRRSIAVHEALFGVAEVRDDSGAVIAKPRAGLIADMAVVMDKLDAPILNGKGANLITTVARVDRRTRELARRVATIEKQRAQ